MMKRKGKKAMEDSGFPAKVTQKQTPIE